MIGLWRLVRTIEKLQLGGGDAPFERSSTAIPSTTHHT